MATAYPGGLRKRGGLLDNEDTIQATPRNPFFGGVADLLGQAYKLPEMPRLGVPGLDFVAANRNRLMDLLGVGDVQKTAEALSYGNRLGTGTGMTYQPLPETVGAALALAPMVAPTARMAGEGVTSTGRFVAPKAGMLAEEYMQGMGMMPGIVQKTPSIGDVDVAAYRGSHKAPGPDFGAPLYDLTGGGQMYPADVYSEKAAQYYGTGNRKADIEAFNLARRVRGNPDAEVTMYRAVPKNVDVADINPGDWVTLSRDYAKTHGESVLNKNYKILSKKVKAKELWTNADSIHEFGYNPSGGLLAP